MTTCIIAHTQYRTIYEDQSRIGTYYARASCTAMTLSYYSFDLVLKQYLIVNLDNELKQTHQKSVTITFPKKYK